MAVIGMLHWQGAGTGVMLLLQGEGSTAWGCGEGRGGRGAAVLGAAALCLGRGGVMGGSVLLLDGGSWEWSGGGG